MGQSKDLIAEKLDKVNVLKKLSAMQEPVDYPAVKLTQQSLLASAVQKIPLLSKYLRNLDETGEAAMMIGERLGDLNDTPGSDSISHGFHFGSVAIASLDFVRIPFIYLAAYVLNQDVPINLNNNARWVYSGVVLALAITAFAVPAAAPIIGLVAASIGLTVSMFLLGKTLYERYQLGKENKKIKKKIHQEEEEMRSLQLTAKNLHDRLTQATEEEQIIAIYTEILLLEEQFIAKKRVIEQLKTEELQLGQKINQVGMLKVLDKSIGVGLAGLTIIGLVLTLFVPQVGLGLLLGVAVVGGIYFAARLTIPLFQTFGGWLVSKFKQSADLADEQTENDNTLTESKEQDSDLKVSSEEAPAEKENTMAPEKQHEDEPHESTADVLLGLHATEAMRLAHDVIPQEASSDFGNHLLLKPQLTRRNKKNRSESEGDGEIKTESEGPHQ